MHRRKWSVRAVWRRAVVLLIEGLSGTAAVLAVIYLVGAICAGIFALLGVA